MKKWITAVATAFVLTISLPVQAESIKRKVCVFDIVGNVGPVMGAMKDWQAAALAWDLEVELIPHTNEAIAAEDLKAGVCDAALITGIRGRNFNKYSGTIDSIGAIPSMEHMEVVLKVLAHPQTADKLSQGSYQIMGLAPAGAAYVFVNDREINSLAKAAGKRVAVLEYDETQAILVSQVGATPVGSDITNFSTKFNNGVVDVLAAPLVAYEVLELYKGMSPDGGIIDYPLAQITMQLIGRKDKFPNEVAQLVREEFFNSYHLIKERLDQEAAKVPDRWWIEIPDADKREYETMMQEARLTLREKGYYDGDMLTLQRKIRCKLNPSKGECADPVE